ncbi:response regulator transcription factor [Kaistia defluvii]|uniref:DNA-binding NarL/FixJ family response regulator n=1 Tax=Kaistia defluvii TaxID=410841 RepID=A0ABV2QVS9_9HYPH
MWNCESVQVAGNDSPGAVAQSSRVKIALIDRRALDRECLAQALLASQPNLEIRAFGSVEEWEAAGARLHDACAVLLSIGGQNPGDAVVAAALSNLEREFPGIPTIVLADSEAASDVLMALDRGARGYIASSSGLRVVVEVVNLVRAGGTYVPASSLNACRSEILAQGIEEEVDPLDALLTPRQAAVAEALRQGKANKIIAYELDLSESTVKVHIRAIMRKLHAHNRTEVAFKLSALVPARRTTARLLSLPAYRDRPPGVRLAPAQPPQPQSAAYR